MRKLRARKVKYLAQGYKADKHQRGTPESWVRSPMSYWTSFFFTHRQLSQLWPAVFLVFAVVYKMAPNKNEKQKDKENNLHSLAKRGALRVENRLAGLKLQRIQPFFFRLHVIHVIRSDEIPD